MVRRLPSDHVTRSPKQTALSEKTALFVEEKRVLSWLSLWLNASLYQRAQQPSLTGVQDASGV